MGSSGEKRKGRKHLPKVGTPQAREYQRRHSHEQALHPFSDDPTHVRGPARWIAPVVIGVLAIIGIVALILLT